MRLEEKLFITNGTQFENKNKFYKSFDIIIIIITKN